MKDGSRDSSKRDRRQHEEDGLVEWMAAKAVDVALAEWGCDGNGRCMSRM